MSDQFLSKNCVNLTEYVYNTKKERKKRADEHTSTVDSVFLDHVHHKQI